MYKLNNNYHKKNKYKNGFSPKFNRLIGSITYFIIFLLIFIISYKLWGWKMFDEIYFCLMHIIAFVGVKFLLRNVLHFWKY